MASSGYPPDGKPFSIKPKNSQAYPAVRLERSSGGPLPRAGRFDPFWQQSVGGLATASAADPVSGDNIRAKTI
jgi:hypothetical protein